ncbi:MAG: glycosyltransferase family 2 protein, partial [bacterium]
MNTSFKLSIIIPVYNEKKTITEIIQKIKQVELNKEIIIIDDCSSDGTREIIKNDIQGDDIVKVFHKKNLGKGAAIRSGLKKVTGDIVIFQDADLEYNPNEYVNLINPIIEGRAEVVYGSRFMGDKPHRVLYFWHYLG